MTLSHRTFWQHLLTAEPSAHPLASDIMLSVIATRLPTYGPELIERGLLTTHGRFAVDLPARHIPRLHAILRRENQAIAHALLMPRPHEAQAQHTLGWVGVYVDTQHRGSGYARICVAALAQRVNAVQSPYRIQAASRILPWVKPLFSANDCVAT